MLKILLADDSPTNRKLMGQMIHSLGYVPVLASDGARALTILEDNPDIAGVITDCQMPVLDGPGLIRAIRTSARPELPILVYSAFIGLKEVAGLLEMGASQFLTYPVKRLDVKEYLERHLPHA